MKLAYILLGIVIAKKGKDDDLKAEVDNPPSPRGKQDPKNDLTPKQQQQLVIIQQQQQQQQRQQQQQANQAKQGNQGNQAVRANTAQKTVVTTNSGQSGQNVQVEPPQTVVPVMPLESSKLGTADPGPALASDTGPAPVPASAPNQPASNAGPDEQNTVTQLADTTPGALQENSDLPLVVTPPSEANVDPNQAKSSNQGPLIMILVIISLILTGALGIYIYVQRKKKLSHKSKFPSDLEESYKDDALPMTPEAYQTLDFYKSNKPNPAGMGDVASLRYSLGSVIDANPRYTISTAYTMSMARK